MRFFSLVLLCWISFTSCQSSGSDVRLAVENLDLDSVGIQFSHYMTGQEILDTVVPVGDFVTISGLPEDMYIVMLRWPRTYIPHHYLRNREFQQGLGTQYLVNKTFYVNPKEQTDYKFSFDKGLRTEDIEMNEVEKVNLNLGECSSCAIAETYWKAYHDFIARKESKIKELSQVYYKALDEKDASSKEKYQQIEAYKQDTNADEAFLNEFDKLTASFGNEAVSSFFVFFQSNMDKGNKRYLKNFEDLKGEALQSPYYEQMLKRNK